MRNPERIDIIIDKLRETWVKSPNLRFHQMLENIMREDKIDSSWYYLEDEEFEKRIDEWNEFLETLRRI